MVDLAMSLEASVESDLADVSAVRTHRGLYDVRVGVERQIEPVDQLLK